MSADYWKPQFIVDRSFHSPVPFLLVISILAMALLDLAAVSSLGLGINWAGVGLSAVLQLARLILLCLLLVGFAILLGKKMEHNTVAGIFTVMGVIQLIGALFGFIIFGLVFIASGWKDYIALAAQTPSAELFNTLVMITPPNFSPGLLIVVFFLILVLLLFVFSLLYRLIRKLTERGFLVTAFLTFIFLLVAGLLTTLIRF